MGVTILGPEQAFGAPGVSSSEHRTFTDDDVRFLQAVDLLGFTVDELVGVGLSLVRRFAELHDGRTWVEDRPGGGRASTSCAGTAELQTDGRR